MTLSSFQKKLFAAFLIITPLLFNVFNGYTQGAKFLTFIVIALVFFLLNEDTKKLKNSFKYPIAILIITGALSAILSNNINLGFWGAYDRCFGFATILSGLFLALGMPKIKPKELINIFIISGTVLSVVALIMGFFVDSSLFEGRISGTMGNPNMLGQFLLVTLFFSIYKFLENKGKINILPIIIQGSALILSGNRASILSLMIVLFIYLISSKKSWKIIASTIVIFGTLAVVLIDRILSFQSIYTRLEIYSAGLKAVFKNPFFGIGFEQVQYAIDIPATYTMMADRVHQFFLDFAIMGGIPFMLAISFLAIFSLIILLKKQRVFGLAFLALLLSLQFNFMGVMDMVVFAIFVGLAIQIKHHIKI